jgi:hypothetical protein
MNNNKVLKINTFNCRGLTNNSKRTNINEYLKSNNHAGCGFSARNSFYKKWRDEKNMGKRMGREDIFFTRQGSIYIFLSIKIWSPDGNFVSQLFLGKILKTLYGHVMLICLQKKRERYSFDTVYLIQYNIYSVTKLKTTIT